MPRMELLQMAIEAARDDLLVLWAMREGPMTSGDIARSLGLKPSSDMERGRYRGQKLVRMYLARRIAPTPPETRVYYEITDAGRELVPDSTA